MNQRSLLLPVALVVLASSGCAFGYREPIYDIGQRRILAIPLRDRTASKNRRWYGESERGIRGTAYFREWAERDGVGNFVVGTDEREVIRAVKNWQYDQFTREFWKKLLAGINVDVILLGEIVDFRTKQPHDINYYQGTASFRYEIVSALSGKTIYRTAMPRELRFPETTQTDIPLTDMAISNMMKKIEIGLLKKIGERIGRDLYGYYPD